MSDVAFAVDLGGTNIQGALLHTSRGFGPHAKRPTPAEGGPQDVIDALGGVVGELCEQVGVETGDLTGVGKRTSAG
jgi:glucokinase